MFGVDGPTPVQLWVVFTIGMCYGISKRTMHVTYLCAWINEHQAVLVDGYEQHLGELGLCALLQNKTLTEIINHLSLCVMKTRTTLAL